MMLAVVAAMVGMVGCGSPEPSDQEGNGAQVESQMEALTGNACSISQNSNGVWVFTGSCVTTGCRTYSSSLCPAGQPVMNPAFPQGLVCGTYAHQATNPNGC
jgi:hypothetical protein